MVTLLLILLSLILNVLSDELSCDFRSPCCWRSEANRPWEIRDGKIININEFRRTFLVGRSKPPPAGKYAMRAETGHGSSFQSCPFCSQDGMVVVQYRHWQSPSSNIKLCWKSISEPLRSSDCQPVIAARQTQFISQQFAVLPQTDIQFLFIVENSDLSTSAVVMLDRIRVVYEKCGSTTESASKAPEARQVIAVDASVVQRELPNEDVEGETRGLSKMKKVKIGTPKLSLAELAILDDRVRAKMLEPRPQAIKEVEHQASQKIFRLDNGHGEPGQLVQPTIPPRPVQKPSPKRRPIPSNASPVLPPKLPKALPAQQFDAPTRVITPSQTPKSIRVPTNVHKPTNRITPAPAQAQVTVPPSPTMKKEFNPLHDLLGEELSNFLDPNYETKDDEEQEFFEEEDNMEAEKSAEPGKEAVSRTKNLPPPPQRVVSAAVSRPPTLALPRTPLIVNAPSPLEAFHRPLPLTIPTNCETPGGCLFENGMCSWRNSYDTRPEARFTPHAVGLSKFVQARVPSGQVSMMEANTTMAETYTVVFDVLEWSQGVRLIGCCLGASNQLQCPFSTPSDAGALIWQPAKFDCPPSTQKLVFICENYGNQESVCGVDNIRLHKTTDILFIEPCQKNQLSSL